MPFKRYTGSNIKFVAIQAVVKMDSTVLILLLL